MLAFKFINNIQNTIADPKLKLDDLIEHLQLLGQYLSDAKKYTIDDVMEQIDKINSKLKKHHTAGLLIKKTDPNIVIIENELSLLKQTVESIYKVDQAPAPTTAKNLKR